MILAIRTTLRYRKQSSGAVPPPNRSAIQLTAAAVLACAERPWPISGITISVTLLPALQSLFMYSRVTPGLMI
jgi:hypothetical protein